MNIQPASGKSYFYLNIFRLLGLWFLLLCLSGTTSCTPKADNPQPAQEQKAGYGTPLNPVPTTDNMVMYEVNLRSFSPNKALQAVTQRLDSIQKLGTNVIWLMPIQRQGFLRGVNSPYAIQNYFEVSPEYGDLNDLRNLTDEAHKRGIAVILDWVANHTAWDNPWVINNPEWFTRVGGSIVHPQGTNWTDVADLNFDSMVMRAEMIKAMKYWVTEANVDGYRCDAANYVPFSFWKQAIDSLRLMPNRKLIMLAEGDRNDHLRAGFDISFSWRYYGALKSVFQSGQTAQHLHTTHQTEFAEIPTNKSWLRFTTNHDESAWDATPVTLFGGLSGAFAAFATTAFSGAIPLIYSSQEVGRAEVLPIFSQSLINWNANPNYRLQYQRMMQVYRSHAAYRSPNYNYIGTADVYAIRKIIGTDTALVVVNTRNNNRRFAPPEGWARYNNRFSVGTVMSGDSLLLGGYGVWVGQK